MRRSGSTLQFNILQRVLQTAGLAFKNLKYVPGKELGTTIDRNKKDNEILVIKCHDIRNAIDLPISKRVLLYTVRDPRDAYLSQKKKSGVDIEHLDQFMEQVEADYELAIQASDILIQRYEQIFCNEINAIIEIGRFVGVELSETLVNLIAKLVQIDNFKPSTSLRFFLKLRNLGRSISRKSVLAALLLSPAKWASNAWNQKGLQKSETQVHFDHISDSAGKSGMWIHQLSKEELELFSGKWSQAIRQMGYKA